MAPVIDFDFVVEVVRRRTPKKSEIRPRLVVAVFSHRTRSIDFFSNFVRARVRA